MVESLGLRELRNCQTRNVLLCRAIARIGEVPQAEGFGNCQNWKCRVEMCVI